MSIKEAEIAKYRFFFLTSKLTRSAKVVPSFALWYSDKK
jgi:hypothetical protein